MTTTSNKRETFADIINGSKPVLVDFFAEWCGPCRLMKPVLEELHTRMGDKVRILKIDVDKSPSVASALQIQSVPTFVDKKSLYSQVASALQIQSVPTLMLFKQGKVLWRKSGVLQASELEKIIKQHSFNS